MTAKAAPAAHLVEDPDILAALVTLYSVGYGSGIAAVVLNFDMSTGVPDEAARRHADAMFADWTAEFYRDPAIRAALEQAVLAHLTRTKHEPFELQVAPR